MARVLVCLLVARTRDLLDDPDEVNGRVAALGGLLQSARVGVVDDGDLGPDHCGQRLEPARRTPRANHRTQRVATALLSKGRYQAAPEVTVGTGDEDAVRHAATIAR